MDKKNASESAGGFNSENTTWSSWVSRGSRALRRLSKVAASASAIFALWGTDAEAATIPVSVSTVPQLYAAFQVADSRPSDVIEIRLAPGVYSLVKNTSTSDPGDTSSRTSGRLKLKYGKVKLIGGANRGASFDFIIDGGWFGNNGYTTAFAMVGVDGSSFRPELYVYGVRFENAWGARMPPIQVLNARFEMYNSSVSNTRVDGSGGGALNANSNSSITISHSFFQYNSVYWAVQGHSCGGSFDSGGALQISNSNAWIENSTFMGGIACRGGGLSFTASSSYRLVVNQSSFIDNVARTLGGGIHIGGVASGSPAVTLNFNTIAHNVAAQQPPNIGFGQPQAGGGVAFDGYTGSLRMVGNLVGNNVTVFPLVSGGAAPDGKDCFISGAFTNSRVVNGNLLRERGNCTFIPTGPLVGTSAAPVDPGIGGLVEGTIGNGSSGTILVRPVVPGSRALGGFQSNSSTSCFATDQLDIFRSFSAPPRCTVGAVEYPF
ncbi:MAG TPA: hypothetical protein VFZ53_26680 [Polyangiaceae bacterium]